MVGHKCVQFQANGVKKSEGYHKFPEPEGMTTVDLKNDAPNTEKVDTVKPLQQWPRTFRKFLVRSIVIIAFILFGIITFLTILPKSEINNLKTLWTTPFKNKGVNQKSDEINRSDKFNGCTTYKTLEECCLLAAGASKLNSVLVQYCKETNLSRNPAEITTLPTDHPNTLPSEYLTSFPPRNPEVKDAVFDFEVKITQMSNPIIENNDVLLTANNTSLRVKKHRTLKSKRSYADEWYRNPSNPTSWRLYNKENDRPLLSPHSNAEEDTIINSFRGISPQEHPLNYFNINYNQRYEDNFPQKRNGQSEYTSSTTQEIAVRNEDQHFKDENPYLNNHNNLENKDKQPQPGPNPNDLQTNQRDFANTPYYQHQCILYAQQVGAPLSVLQPPQISPYEYNPSPKFMPIPRTLSNSYMISPQYSYLNPPYIAQTPHVYPLYPYNSYYWSHNAQTPQGHYYLCPLISAPSAGYPYIADTPGVEERESSTTEKPISKEVNNKIRISNRCPISEVSCVESHKCIRQTQVCDTRVDCPDASDEVFCSCVDRIMEDRLCDGYFDCPNGEDELGCFGCDADSFICDVLQPEKKETNCISKSQRCDGIVQCANSKDEEDCSIIADFHGKPMQLHQVSKAKGFLFRNYKGLWYPTCSGPREWITEVCNRETGRNNFSPLVYMVPVPTYYKGPYLNKLDNSDIDITSFCFTGYATYAQCPPPNCGVRNPPISVPLEDLDESVEDAISRFKHKRDNNGSEIVESSRVVGGSPSQPAAWPWVVSMYRNGLFHCGGVIISENWILTAAHCVNRFTRYYYEIEAGILRRFSYSPMQQTRFVTHIVTHSAYDRANLKNDLAMMKLSKPLTYNRYVRPICLPSEFTAGRDYLKEPTPGTLCTAVGWGATVERGYDPDHLREVEVPVLRKCKHIEDEEPNAICAGYHEGGKDACQGDSGGPFMCKSLSSPDQWYLAGIVSHGEGCARPNEPGVYTRISLYLDWIHRHLHVLGNHHILGQRPLHKCPGYSCKSSKKCLPKKRRCDGIVDCLHGDDEIHCEENIIKVFRNAMGHMILENTIRNETEEKDDATPNKLDAGDKEVTTTVTTDVASTLITDKSTLATGVNDNIFGTTAFKMENNPTPSDLNRNEFGYTVENTLFASSPKISDESQPISSEENLSMTANAYSMATVTSQWNPNETDNVTETNTELVSSLLTATIVETATTHSAMTEDYFKCTRMLQIIPLSKRCDKVADCEDVSDEEDCKCVDYLRHFHPETICDGSIDCNDLSDEDGCGITCNEDEYLCSSNKTCISLDKRCDNILHCLHGEDEWDCFILTDGSSVVLDPDLRPHFNTKGIIAFYFEESWWPMCFKNWTDIKPKVASELCLSLGFSDYEAYFDVKVDNHPLRIMIGDGGPDPIAYRSDENSEICNGLYIECSNASIIEWHSEMQNKENVHMPLWNAAIFVDGKYKCTGALLNMIWVLTSFNCFRGISELDSHYVTVLLGIGGGYLDIVGPHEQIRLVAESMAVLYSDIFLLRLEKAVVYTRYVRPLHFSRQNEIHRLSEKCYATGRTKANKLTLVELIRIANCTSGSKCFKRRFKAPAYCDDPNSEPWSGPIICESGNAFYPSAVFYEENGVCGFQRSTAFTTISLFLNAIFNIFEHHGDFTSPPKKCQGFRCTLGQCIESRRICNGIPDCRDGEDENTLMCREWNTFCHLSNKCDCAKNEITCGNGRCVSKSAFCNNIIDCEDESDEPDICNCFNYLKMTSPEKICDGVRNCLDRTDENLEICKCDAGKYSCAENKFCIPMEMVCDGYTDCPNGDDETDCIQLRPLNDNPNASEVVIQTAGIWHQGCFGENITHGELQEICHRLGFRDSNEDYLEYFLEIDKEIKRPILDPFSVVWLNRNSDVKFKLAIRNGDHPFGKQRRNFHQLNELLAYTEVVSGLGKLQITLTGTNPPSCAVVSHGLKTVRIVAEEQPRAEEELIRCRTATFA
ncbi:hypothetical protein Trydic_g1491 [Trypoxylus dichotomus]